MRSDCSTPAACQMGTDPCCLCGDKVFRLTEKSRRHHHEFSVFAAAHAAAAGEFLRGIEYDRHALISPRPSVFPWLPDGYSQIFRSYVFGPSASGLWLRYATLQNLIPSFPWIAPPRPPPWRNPRKGRDQILPSGNLAQPLPPNAGLVSTGSVNWMSFRLRDPLSHLSPKLVPNSRNL